MSLAFAILAFALTIGIAGATFVRLFGITFLSKARSVNATNAVEVPKLMLIGKAVLASSCIILGILPFVGMNLIVSAFNLPYMPSGPFETVSIANSDHSNFASLMMPGVLVILTSVFVGVFVFVRIIGGKTRMIKYGTWDCGFGSLSEKTQYTATSLAEPIRRIFGVFYKPHNDIAAEFYTKKNLYLKKSINVISTTRNIFDEKLYGKTISGSLFVLNKIRKIQSGKVNAYILYIMVTLVALLLFVGFGMHE